MRVALLVARHEYLSVLRSRGFLFATFGVPLLAVLVSLVIIEVVIGAGTGPAQVKATAFVDQAGLVSNDEPFTRFPNVAQARSAYDEALLDAWFLIPADYMASGDVTLHSRNESSEALQDSIDDFLRANLAQWAGSTLPPERLARPVELRIRAPGLSLAAEDVGGVFMLQFLYALAFFIALQTTSGYLIASVVEEKSSRMLEILVTSVTPLQLMFGKIVGLGCIGLTQLGVWLGFALTLRLLQPELPGIGASQLPPELVLVTIAYFLLSYFLMAAIFVGIGSITDSEQESRQLAGILTLVTVIPFMAYAVLLTEPDGTLGVALTLFPLTAPLTAIIRLNLGAMPHLAARLESGAALHDDDCGGAARGASVPLVTAALRRAALAASTVAHPAQPGAGESAAMNSPLWQVFRFEFLRNLRRRGYLFMAVAVPLLALLLLEGSQLMGPGGNLPGINLPTIGIPGITAAGAGERGLVDETGNFASGGELQHFADTAAAESALARGEISSWYHIPADYLETGMVTQVLPRFSVNEVSRSAIRTHILTSLADELDAALLARLKRPSRLTVVSEQRVVPLDEDLSLLVIYPFVMALMISLFMTSGYLLQGVIEEKETRVVEILLSSLRPAQLFGGKVLAYGALGLLQLLYVAAGHPAGIAATAHTGRPGIAGAIRLARGGCAPVAALLRAGLPDVRQRLRHSRRAFGIDARGAAIRCDLHAAGRVAAVGQRRTVGSAAWRPGRCAQPVSAHRAPDHAAARAHYRGAGLADRAQRNPAAADHRSADVAGRARLSRAHPAGRAHAAAA